MQGEKRAPDAARLAGVLEIAGNVDLEPAALRTALSCLLWQWGRKELLAARFEELRRASAEGDAEDVAGEGEGERDGGVGDGEAGAGRERHGREFPPQRGRLRPALGLHHDAQRHDVVELGGDLGVVAQRRAQPRGPRVTGQRVGDVEPDVVMIDVDQRVAHLRRPRGPATSISASSASIAAG